MFNIIKYTLLEVLRSRLYLISMAIVIVIAWLSYSIAQINDIFGHTAPAILAFGTFFTKVIALIFLIAAPTFGMATEVENGDIQFTLARLKKRGIYLMAKYFAYLILYAALLILSALVLGITTVISKSVELPHLIRSLCLFVYSEFLGGAILLSLLVAIYNAIRAPVVTAVFTATAYFVSLMLDTAKNIAETTHSLPVKMFYYILYYVYPGFRFFNLEEAVVNFTPVDFVYMATMTGYAAAISVVCLFIAARLFNKREF